MHAPDAAIELLHSQIADADTRRASLTFPQRSRFYRLKHGTGRTGAAGPGELRCLMDDEPKTAAEMKEIRLNRKRAQDAEGIKAMAEIAAADVAIRKRTARLRALRLAKEAADRAKPVAAKAGPGRKKST